MTFCKIAPYINSLTYLLTCFHHSPSPVDASVSADLSARLGSVRGVALQSACRYDCVAYFSRVFGFLLARRASWLPAAGCLVGRHVLSACDRAPVADVSQQRLIIIVPSQATPSYLHFLSPPPSSVCLAALAYMHCIVGVGLGQSMLDWWYCGILRDTGISHVADTEERYWWYIHCIPLLMRCLHARRPPSDVSQSVKFKFHGTFFRLASS